MSPIFPNRLGPDFPAQPPAVPVASGSATSGAFAGFSGAAGAVRGDNIRYQTGQPVLPGGDLFGGGAAGAPAGGSAFTGIMSAFMDALSSLFSQLGSLFGAGAAQPGGTTPAGGGTQPGTSPSTPAQTFFDHASGGSVGDPHDSFSGATEAGRNVASRWDNMRGHDDLLDSDSFAGGYRVATTVTQPGKNGITQNGSASVSTDGGATEVTLNRDGSYSAVSQGRSLDLKAGQSVSAGSATVTLNADRSLTVVDRNATGGRLSTTLKANGSGGVDVSNTAHDVDLGGYLVDTANGTAPLTPGASNASAAAPQRDSYATDWSKANITLA